MPLLFPTVLLFLFIGSLLDEESPFLSRHEAIWAEFPLRKVRQAFGKFLVGLCGDKAHCFMAGTKNMRQAMHESIAMLLTHPETSRMVLLHRVILQIDKDKEKTFGNIRQRTVLVNTETATVGVEFISHIIFRQIVIMSSLKVRKKTRELNMAQAGEHTETHGIISMFVVSRRPDRKSVV